MKFQPPRGTRDYLPEDMKRRREIFDKIREVFESFGYGEVGTPAFEDFELLAKKAGADIEKEIYCFLDKSGRKLGLRFDPTVPICRIIASRPGMPKPLKFYYITNMWRYDRPQKGRFREFWQAGVELIGSPKKEADVEVIVLVAEALKAIGIKSFEFRINSRENIEALIKKAGIKSKPEIFRALDKLAKLGPVGVEKELVSSGMKKAKARKLLSLVKGGKGMKEVLGLLRKRGIKNVKADLSIVRGIDYYTGFVFETFVKGFEDLGSVASGGRYDSLIRQFGGEDLPATGFGIGIERLMDILGKGKPEKKGVFVLNVKSFGRECVRLAEELRASGISVETDLMERSLRKQMDYANSKGFKWVVFVGKNELSSKRYTLRDMVSGKEARLSVTGIAKKLRK